MKKKSTGVKECIFKVFYLLIYFWLCWVFVAVLGLSLVAANGANGGCSSCGAQASHSGGHSRFGAQAFECTDFSSGSPWT